MTTSKKAIPQRDFKLHIQLAMALGWTEIVINGGAFLGRPPGGSPRSRDQARIPNWLGDFNECMSLALLYNVFPDRAMAQAEMSRDIGVSKEQALRRGIVSTLLSVLHLDAQRRENIERIVNAEFQQYAAQTKKGDGE